MTNTKDAHKDGIPAVIALARGQGMRRAVEDSGLSQSTILRRMKDRGFADDVARARQTMLEAACAQLSELMLDAIATLAGLLDPKCPPNIRLRAATGILEHAAKVRAVCDLEQRLDALEELM